jgi:hypothetical protein
LGESYTASELEDEFHYLLQCSYFSNERCKMLPYDVYTRPNIDKFKDLLCTDDYITLQAYKCEIH